MHADASYYTRVFTERTCYFAEINVICFLSYCQKLGKFFFRCILHFNYKTCFQVLSIIYHYLLKSRRALLLHIQLLGKKKERRIKEYVFLFFPENRIRHFMQMASLGDRSQHMQCQIPLLSNLISAYQAPTYKGGQRQQGFLIRICVWSRPRWLSWMRRPTGDQEVAGSTPAEVGNILSWRLIMKYFLRSFSPFR